MDDVAASMAQLRQTMVDCQLRTFDVTDHAILSRFGAVPRERFLPESLHAVVYSDRISSVVEAGERRQLLVPMVLARMLQAANIESSDKVLMIGGGYGYGAAIVAGLAGEVVALENNAGFSAKAAAVLESLGLPNARAVTGPLDGGYPAAAPYDVIVIEGAFERHPTKLLQQLKSGGRLVGIRSQGSAVAGRAVRFDLVRGGAGSQGLFSCSGQVLPGLADDPGFRF